MPYGCQCCASFHKDTEVKVFSRANYLRARDGRDFSSSISRFQYSCRCVATRRLLMLLGASGYFEDSPYALSLPIFLLFGSCLCSGRILPFCFSILRGRQSCVTDRKHPTVLFRPLKLNILYIPIFVCSPDQWLRRWICFVIALESSLLVAFLSSSPIGRILRFCLRNDRRCRRS